MLNYEFPPIGSGGGRQSKLLAEEYSKNNKVYFLTVGWNNYGLEKKDNLIIHRLKTKRKGLDKCTIIEQLDFVRKAWKKIPAIINSFKPDRIHIFFTVPTGLLTFHPKINNIPFIVSVRGSDVPGHNPNISKIIYGLTKPIVKKIWKKAKWVISNSDDMKKEINVILPNLDVKVVPNGIDTKNFKPKKYALENKINLLFVGRLIPLKRVDIIIKNINSIERETGKEVNLKIVGSGQEELKLRELTRKIGVENKVRFTGRISYEKLVEEYQSSHIYIQLSTIEGMSNTIMEAMACGLPIISTNVGDASKFVKENGFIVEDFSRIPIFVDKIIKNYDDMKKTSVKIANKYSFSKNMLNYEELII